jgi:hypothetical protein
MNDLELMALTEDDVKKAIDYECAIEGIPLMPADPGPEPVAEAIKPDLTVYGIVGVYFLEPSRAADVLEALTSGSIYDDEGYGDEKRIKEIDSGHYGYPKISTEQMLSREKYLKVQEQIERHKREKKTWEVAKKAFDSAYKLRTAIVDEVNALVGSACERKVEQDRFRYDFGRYLPLANGNTTIAMNFLLKANREAGEKYPEVVQELCPGYGSPTAEPAAKEAARILGRKR